LGAITSTVSKASGATPGIGSLYPYRGVPQKFFHLYLAEICYRFNHRDEDI
jgi:transposase-like protein